jgi:hypothetical protein
MALPESPPPVMLRPHFGLAVTVVVLGLACLALLPLWSGALWLALAITLFGLFLVVQTALLRLEFSAEDLVVRRGGAELRRFPYEAWLSWRLFWPALPALLYFRERQSIHLLPVLFDATALRQQLQQHLPGLETGGAAGTPSPHDAA